ncbi:MAG: Pyridoxamine 5'-phosphate oxidase, partial [uncultured Thermomicrobiales bacterium]
WPSERRLRPRISTTTATPRCRGAGRAISSQPSSSSPRPSSARHGRTAAPTPPGSVPSRSTATSISRADRGRASPAIWPRIRPARSPPGWRPSTSSSKARRSGSPLGRPWSGWPRAAGRAAGRCRSRATPSRPRTAPRAPARRPGTSTASPSIPPSGTPRPSRTARRAGASRC